MNHRSSSIRIFSLFGIPIRIHISWLIIFFLITVSFVAGFRQKYDWPGYVNIVAGVAGSLAFFISVLLHELSHSIVAVSRGMQVKDIVLFVFGGVSEIEDEPDSAGSEFLMALVGPMMSFAIGAICFLLYLLTARWSEPVSVLAFHLFVINMLLGGFNLIPGFPLDGGRVLRSVIWALSNDLEKATRWAVRVGSAVAYGMILFGVFLMLMVPGALINGLWLAFIGWFLNNAAQSALSQAMLKHALHGYTVRSIMTTDLWGVPPQTSLQQLVHEHILTQAVRCIPVVEDGRLLGLATIHSVKSAPSDQWPSTPVSQVMVPLEEVKSVGPDEPLYAAVQQMTQADVNQLPVVQEGQLVGMLRRDTLMRFLSVRSELSA